MPDYDTLTELLIDQPERKLRKLETSIVREIERLGGELKIVQAALARQNRTRDANVPAVRPKRKTGNGGTGRFEGLARRELLAHVVAMDQSTFRPQQVREYLGTRGVVRRVEAVRNGLMRLVDDGSLERRPDGSFAVPASNGNGAKVETEDPLPGFSVSQSGGAPPDK